MQTPFTLQEVRDVLPLLQEFNEPDAEILLSPYIAQATREFESSYGPHLVEKYRERFLPALANRALYLAVPQLDIRVTAAGFVVTNTDKQSPASKDRVAALRASCESVCAKELESVLHFLIAAEPEIRQSPIFRVVRPYLFRTYGDYVFCAGGSFDGYVVFREAAALLQESFFSPRDKGIIAGLLEALDQKNANETQTELIRLYRLALRLHFEGRSTDSILSRISEIQREDPGSYPPVVFREKEVRKRLFSMC